MEIIKQAITMHHILPATNAHTTSIQHVVFTVLREYSLTPDPTRKDKDLSDIEHYYLSNGGYFAIAIDENTQEVVGTIGLYPTSKDVCELRKMYLLKSARGIGLGKRMLSHALEKARELGFKKVTLETISPLKEAIALYQKAGFREVTPREVSERVDRAFELEL